jgi:hypothetical protein
MLPEQELDDVVRACCPAGEIALVAGQQASYGQRVPDDKPGRDKQSG